MQSSVTIRILELRIECSPHYRVIIICNIRIPYKSVILPKEISDLLMR